MLVMFARVVARNLRQHLLREPPGHLRLALVLMCSQTESRFIALAFVMHPDMSGD